MNEKEIKEKQNRIFEDSIFEMANEQYVQALKKIDW